MDTRTKINSIIRSAEKLHQSEDYINAFQEWDNVVTELNIIIKTTKKSRMVTKAGGWIAAFATGGLWFEDLIIAPAVNKFLMHAFKIDIEFLIRKLSYSLNQRQACLYNSPDLCKITNFRQELTYFAFSYHVANSVETSSEKLKKLIELVNPLEDSLDLRFHKSVPSLLDDIYEVISNGRISQEIRILNLYLSQFLDTHKKTNNSVYKQITFMKN